MRRLFALVTSLVFIAPACVPDGGGGDDPTADSTPPDIGGVLGDIGFDPIGAAPPAPDAALETTDLGPEADAAPPRPACSDGLDNDRDGRVDHPDDPGCQSPDDDDETDPPPRAQCDNQLDDDGDGLYDLHDPDCTGPLDPRESGGNTDAVCSDQIDNDADGLIDFPADPGCVAAGHNTEADASPAPACANDLDDDGDGLIDYPHDPGCAGRGDDDEADPPTPPQCANGVDDDGNGQTDHPADTGCDAAGDLTEVSPCGVAVPYVDLNAHLAEHDAFDGDLTGRASGLVATCGGAAGGEYAFRYVVDTPLDRLRFDTQHPETTAPVVMYRRASCHGADLECDRGTPDAPGVAFEIARPPLGTYVVVVDTGSRDQIGAFRLTVDAVHPPACRNTRDDDGDGHIDLDDPGCTETEDDDETDPPTPPVCANGLDDDGDGATDYPADPDCPAAGGDREQPPCALDAPYVIVGQVGGEFELPASQGAGVAQGRCSQDIGAEALIALTLTEPSAVEITVLNGQGAPATGSIHARRVCEDLDSEIACRRSGNVLPLTLDYLARGTYYIFVEQGFAAPATPNTARVVVDSLLGPCNDLADNDGDGRVDLADPGCADPLGDREDDPAVPPQCADGLDNDGNGAIDYPADDGCRAAGDDDEEPDCSGIFYGDVCVAWVSDQCIEGSARQLCADRDARVITLDEFRAVVAGGWERPNASFHTMSVDEYDQCQGDVGNVGIPGWRDFTHWNCGDEQNYCNRAVMCVQ